jgi:putative SOS response-associated peptidase YedK
MPVILAKEDCDWWLDPGLNDVQVISERLRPYNASRMRCFPVSSRVNQVQNDGAEFPTPIQLEEAPQRQLFG